MKILNLSLIECNHWIYVNVLIFGILYVLKFLLCYLRYYFVIYYILWIICS